MGRPDPLMVLRRDGLIGLAEVEEDRALRPLLRGVGDAAAVVTDRAGDAVDPRGGEPRERAPEAGAHAADREAFGAKRLHRGAHVLDAGGDRELPPYAPPA